VCKTTTTMYITPTWMCTYLLFKQFMRVHNFFFPRASVCITSTISIYKPKYIEKELVDNNTLSNIEQKTHDVGLPITFLLLIKNIIKTSINIFYLPTNTRITNTAPSRLSLKRHEGADNISAGDQDNNTDINKIYS